MNIPGSPRLLAALLLASLALNLWQFLRPLPPADDAARKSVASATSPHRPVPGPLLAKQAEVEPDEEEDDESSVETISPERPPDQRSEDELIYGVKAPAITVRRVEDERVSTKRLKEMAETTPSTAERFQVRARLKLPGDRVVDLGSVTGPGEQTLPIRRTKEFPFPVSFTLPRVDASPQDGQPGFPIIPNTPAHFEFKNTGLEIELDVTPAPGALIVGGNFTQTVFEGFEQMPGEAFSPIQDDAGILLTDNKVLQPQFTTRESPFVAAATAGQPCQIPVLMSFGHTVLELTCTPVE